MSTQRSATGPAQAGPVQAGPAQGQAGPGRGWPSRRLPAVLAVAAPPAAAAALVPFRSSVTNTALALVMVAVVVVVVTPGRRLAALAAGVSAGVWFDFFLTRPYESFTISHSADIQTSVLLLVVAVGVGEIAARDRHHRAESTSANDGLAAIQTVSRMVADGDGAEKVLATVGAALVPLLNLDACHFDASREPVTIPYIERPGYVSYSVYRWDSQSAGLPVSPVTLPVKSGPTVLGRFVLQGSARAAPLEDQRLVTALVLADLAAVVLARQGDEPPAVTAGHVADRRS